METRPNDYDYLFKVCILGDSRVGKSSIMLRFADDSFSEEFNVTIGVDVRHKTISVNNTLIRVRMWDTAGHERFRLLTVAAYRNIHGVIIVYDVTNESSFRNVDMWVSEMWKYSYRSDSIKILVGNKCELESERQVPYEEGQKKAQQHGMKFIQTSAKASTNVDSVFNLVASQALRAAESEDSIRKKTDPSFEKKIKKLSPSEDEITKYAACC